MRKIDTEERNHIIDSIAKMARSGLILGKREIDRIVIESSGDRAQISNGIQIYFRDFLTSNRSLSKDEIDYCSYEAFLRCEPVLMNHVNDRIAKLRDFGAA
jgi:hypothetical protein